ALRTRRECRTRDAVSNVPDELRPFGTRQIALYEAARQIREPFRFEVPFQQADPAFILREVDIRCPGGVETALPPGDPGCLERIPAQGGPDRTSRVRLPQPERTVATDRRNELRVRR